MYNVIRRDFKNNMDAEKVFDRLFENFWDFGYTKSWSPPVDFHEDDENYSLTMEIPGISKDDVDISVEHNVLKVSGEKKQVSDSNRTERVYGKFSRSFSVPESIDKEKISAKFENGILTIKIPKPPVAKPTRILIE